MGTVFVPELVGSLLGCRVVGHRFIVEAPHLGKGIFAVGGQYIELLYGVARNRERNGILVGVKGKGRGTGIAWHVQYIGRSLGGKAPVAPGPVVTHAVV